MSMSSLRHHGDGITGEPCGRLKEVRAHGETPLAIDERLSGCAHGWCVCVSILPNRYLLYQALVKDSIEDDTPGRASRDA